MCVLTVVSFNPETGLIIQVSGVEKVGVPVAMAALRSLVVSTVAYWVTSAAFYKREVRPVLHT